MNSSEAFKPSPITRYVFLVVINIAVAVGLSSWNALLNNFAIETVGINGLENGLMQSLREIPGFLAFTTVFFLLLIREQTFALIALATFGVGIAITGLFPSMIGFYCCVLLMSVGFHYLDTLRQSLALQWLPKRIAPRILGRLSAFAAGTSLVTFGAIFLLLKLFELEYRWIYIGAGIMVLAIVVGLKLFSPRFEAKTEQRKNIVIRKRYWLYYCLTAMSGARRQIFVAFAGFLMVQRFGLSAASMALLMLVNHIFTLMFAEVIGRMVGRIGERRALMIEYAGLVLVFTSYAIVESPWLAGSLYVIDHFFFSFAIAVKTYFQKISDPGDIASSAGVSFTINHSVALVVPAILGIVWMQSYAYVFLIGACFAFISFLLALNIPSKPGPGREVRLGIADPQLRYT